MTLKVRDEEDILGDNLRFHLAQGIDFFVVTDNLSRDRTPEILEAWRAAGLMHVLHDDGAHYFTDHGDWVTNMARVAASEHGADWVVHTDADEFWWPVTGTLRDVLAAVREPYSLLHVPRPEFLPRPDGPGSFAERLIFRETRSRLRPKMAHRAAPDVTVSGGGHTVTAPGDGAPMRPPGRLAARSHAEPIIPLRFVAAPWWPVRILHYPNRSAAHFTRRMEHYAADESFPNKGAIRDVRAQLAEGRLHERWDHLLLTEEEIEAGVRSGRFARDTVLRDFLAGCPDPLTEGVEAAQRFGRELAAGLDPAHAQGELDVLALDMMEAHARTDANRERLRTRNRVRSERAQGKLDEVEERAREVERRNTDLRRRLADLESSRWWRLGGALTQRARRTRADDGGPS